MDLYFVTGNPKKFAEVEFVLKNTKINLIQKSIDFQEPRDSDVKVVSMFKAKQAFDILQKPLIVEDTGCEFEAYPGFPGSYPKMMYELLGLEWFEKLLNWKSSRWKFFTVFSYMDWTLYEPRQFVGDVWGNFRFLDWCEELKNDPMSYNSIFFPDWFDVCVNDMYEEWKTISHRGKAVLELKEFLD